MSKLTIYHNKNCGTSKKALALLEDAGADVDVRLYMKEPLSAGELGECIDILEDDPADLVRKDKFFKDQGLDADDYTDKDSVIGILVEHPRLMQRPVVVKGERSVIGRPVERIDELL